MKISLGLWLFQVDRNQNVAGAGKNMFFDKQVLFTAIYKFSAKNSFIKKITQTAVINIVFQRIFKELDVSYASPHTFSKVTVTIFEN